MWAGLIWLGKGMSDYCLEHAIEHKIFAEANEGIS
jgi:hypothetical protein